MRPPVPVGRAPPRRIPCCQPFVIVWPVYQPTSMRTILRAARCAVPSLGEFFAMSFAPSDDVLPALPADAGLAPDATRDLLQRVQSRSYTPRRADAGRLLQLLLTLPSQEFPDPGQTEVVRAQLSQALDRIPAAAFSAALALAVSPSGDRRPWDRVELFALLGRWAVASLANSDEATAAATLTATLELLGDDDVRAARQVVMALGKLPSAQDALSGPVQDALLARVDRLSQPADVRAYVEALGKLSSGSTPQRASATLSALAALGARQDWPPVVRDAMQKAAARVGRDADRAQLSSADASIATDRPLPGVYTVALRCRAGLSPILRAELRERGLLRGALLGCDDPVDRARRLSPHTSGEPARLLLQWSDALSPLLQARTYYGLSFELYAQTTATGPLTPDEICQTVTRVLTGAPTRRLLTTLSRGPVRYRLHLVDGGPQRALVHRIASEVARLAPELKNDPIASPWQVEVTTHAGLRIELLPRHLTADPQTPLSAPDARFAYRRQTVAAASHPPLAAALARLLAAGPDDVVWDPFVGGGSELVEVALLGRCRRLIGGDLDDAALSAARENIAAADVSGVTLLRADALSAPPAGVTHVICNPPMGRRTRPGQLSAFLRDFVAHIARGLPVGGRFVWVSPQPNLTVDSGRQNGLTLRSARPVDLNGFWGQIEVWDKSAAAPLAPPDRGTSHAGSDEQRRRTFPTARLPRPPR